MAELGLGGLADGGLADDGLAEGGLARDLTAETGLDSVFRSLVFADFAKFGGDRLFIESLLGIRPVFRLC